MKIRPDSLFAALTPEQRETLFGWLCVEAMSYRDAQHRIKTDFGVETSIAALSNFYSQHSWPWRVEKAKLAARASSKDLPKDLDAQLKARVQQALFETALDRMSLTEALALQQVLTDGRKLELEEKKVQNATRRVELLEAKMKQAGETLTDTKLSPEEKQQKFKEIFGMA